MPKKIDHEERKEKILQTALKVFAREGYRDSNLSLIATECGISRPTIYQYFKDREEIYYYAVKLVTGRMFNKYATYAWSTDQTYIDRIKNICMDIMQTASEHDGELTSLVDVMLQMKKEGRDFNEIVLRRTAKLTILFKRLLRMGIKEDDIVECDVNKVADHLLLLLESSCFQVAFLDTFDMQLSKQLVGTYLDFYRKTDVPSR
ncbi:MAG: TetR/AcrR family transcriptional regulator [Sphaerochaeta sp.]|jgi:AcrR family transcriptional regulator|uniref:TetR/AcrR family transcriptional regulator n=1 Tax=Sphaerochaeta sp. TaxID=1972642 RepID=UPI002FC812A6